MFSSSLKGVTAVQDKYLDVWAKYYIKFFEAYSEYNISFWGLTTQNEPVNGVYGADIPNNGFNSTKTVNLLTFSY